VAFVWFTTHFGGGFASGRQIVEFFAQFGWYAVFTPIISVAIISAVLYFAWSFAVKHKTYDYLTWSSGYFKPLGKALTFFFEIVIEVMYIIILLLATGIALATGGTLVSEILPNVSYSACTVALAVLIFVLTIWGAETVRRAAASMAILIIAGMLVIYLTSLYNNFPKLAAAVSAMPSPADKGGFGEALWQSVKYAGLQCAVVGAYIAVADALKTQDDVKKTTLVGFVLNAGMLMLAMTGVFAFYPEINAERMPIIYVTLHGGGGEPVLLVVSLIILLAVVSTGVGMVYGGARRVSNWWKKKTGTGESRAVDVIAPAVYILVAWCLSTFGLIGLIAQGYGWVGILSTPLVVIPILLMGFVHRRHS
jgi:uncharacterized membrane protein YkvI